MQQLQQLKTGLYYYPGSINGAKVAAFDLDGTLIRTVRGQFPKDDMDWAWLPHRLSSLQSLRNQGYTLAIFTNQGYLGSKLNIALRRVENVISALETNGVEPWVFVAADANSLYRKPNPFMWEEFLQYLPRVDMANSFYCGDAAGRPTDHAPDDIMFAKITGLTFYTPEQIFPHTEITIPDTQTMFIFVGMPGSGKTTFYQQYLQQRGWVHAHQDDLKTMARMLSTVSTALVSGKSVAIDATNPSVEKRREFINLAIKYQVPTMILYFVNDGHGRNKLRPNPVPNVAYNVYYKNLVEPTEAVDGVPVVELE